MQLLTRERITERLDSNNGHRIFISPLLDNDQIGAVTVDFRIGYDFLVSVLTRKPFISVNSSEPDHRSTASYFQLTRREIGDRFILYPGQLVLATTLEYVGLPADVIADVVPRSSYSRLGIHFHEVYHPGYRGCLPLELANMGNNPIEVIVGSRIAQGRFFSIDEEVQYHDGDSKRKYFAVTRPTISRAQDDKDIGRLSQIRKARWPS